MDLREQQFPYREGQQPATRVLRNPKPADPDASSQLIALQHLIHLSDLQKQVSRPEFPPAANGAAAVVGRHREPQSRRHSLLRRHGSKFTSFALIGGGIFVAGLLIQAVLTSGLHVSSVVSYLVQAVVSVESSYFLNRWVTWRRVHAPFWSSFLRFNLQKVVTVTLNLVLYGILLRLGVEYLLANILLTVLFTFVNYIGADRLVFLRGAKQMVAAVTGPLPMLRVTGELRLRLQPAWRELPSVSVVIPVRSNEKTIRAAVESILSQDYPLLRELILVGSPGDSTWSALREVRDPRLFVMETETPPGIRDANFKRDLGIRQTRGDLISLIDSDMVIPRDWMSRAVELLQRNDVDCVAGVMRSIRDDFWGRFVDGNRLGAKTPRATSAYLVTADGFGAGAYKPPITADILFTWDMYQDCPIDSTWSHGSLEDYEWFWRVVERGHRVMVSNKLFGWHHHRAGFKALSGEYRRSARGCAYFIRAHRESPFAQKRITQAVVLPTAVLGALLGLLGAAYTGYGLLAVAGLAALAVSGVTLLSLREFITTRTAQSLLYPIPALVFGVNYTASLVFHLMKTAPVLTLPDPYVDDVDHVDVAPAGSRYAMPEPAARLVPTPRQAVGLFLTALALGIAIRMWRLGVLPAWQWDEAVYWRVTSNVQHGWLTEHDIYGVPWEPFLYQPPIYFLVESRWFNLVGASIYHARIFGVLCTAVMQVLLFRLLWRVNGPRVALFSVIPVIFDGWLLYIERVSYIENVLMVLIVLGFLLYKQAIDGTHWGRFLLAGLTLGAAASFKQTGAYVIVAVLLCWLIIRRQHKEHLILVGCAASVFLAYFLVMAFKYHPWYVDQSLVQVRRVLGLQQSGGTLTSPVRALHLLTQQYKYFVPSLLVAGSAFALAVKRTWQCIRRRSWEPVRDTALLYAWFVTGAVVFGASSLKFPQYFVLILLPAYCYLWTGLAYFRMKVRWRKFWPVAAAIVGLCSFLLTVPAFNANSLEEVQAYAAKDIPARAIVVTELSIGDLIQQRYCTVEQANACVGHATYAITWQTYLQSSFDQGNAAFRALMQGATSVASFSGAVGTATVWKLRTRKS